MSRVDGSAFPPFPSDADWWAASDALHRESDELPDQALWPLLAGDVLQSPSRERCMCGRSYDTDECERCQQYLAEFRQWDREQAKDRAARSGWRKPPQPEEAA